MPNHKDSYPNIQTLDGSDRLFRIQELIDGAPAGFRIQGIKNVVYEHTGISPSRFDHLRFARLGEPRMIKYDEALKLAHLFDVPPMDLFNLDYETLLSGVPKIIDLNYSDYR